MHTVSFSKIFKGNYLNYVTKYKENIQKVLNSYDIVIFMARKAICFYESMVANGEIRKTDCEVFSSRVIDYNIIQGMKGKKIAIVDDVVVRGTSLRRVINLLNEENIKAYVLVVACQSSFPSTIVNSVNFEMCDSYVTFSEEDIYSFAGMITEYIESSMCPFNVDQPIYTLNDVTEQQLRQLIVNYKAVDISSGLQKKFGIENKVIYFKLSNVNNSSTLLNLIPKETILKIRLMLNGSKIIAIPFVLLPEITIKKLEEMYSVISNYNLDNFIFVNNSLITLENKMKVVSYFFSELLAKTFFCYENLSHKKIIDNDIFQFSIEIDKYLNSDGINLNNESTCLANTAICAYSEFEFSSIIGICYNSVIVSKINDIFFDSNNLVIEERIITHDYLKKNLECYNDAELLASSVIDVFIDRGMMVPTIVHSEFGIIRAYKMGEYSKLTRSQIESFAAMLYQYQEMINCELGKTELEKLCVLYFNTAINRGIFPQQAHYEDDCYSICYSLFGPRVSTSNTLYNANSDSVLITDFCQKKGEESIVTYRNGKYTINPYYASGRMAHFVVGFAHPYSSVYKMFNSKTEQTSSEKWNMYVHTYVQYLTLRAIGNNKRNQYLSLCAELYQLSKLKDDFFELKSKDSKESEWILKGINSGLWKYWCYKNDALNKTSLLIFEKNPDVGSWLLSDVEPPFDETEGWDILIEDAARLLYRSAFLINEVLKNKNGLDLFDTGDGICEHTSDASSKKTIFTIGSYYAEFKELRHDYENEVTKHAISSPDLFERWSRWELKSLKALAKHQLDLCDQVLEHSTAKYASIKKLLVVYSPSGVFPVNISDGMNELYFEGIDQGKFCKIFGLSIKKSNFADFTDLLDRIDLYSAEYDLKYFVFDVGEDNAINFIENEIKDSQLAQILNYTIESFAKREFNKEPELVLVGPKSYDGTFKHGNHQFTSNEDTASQIIKRDLNNSLYGHNGHQLSITLYSIQDSTVYIEGENSMKINKVGHIENIVEQNGNNSSNTIIRGDYNSIPKDMIELLNELIKQVDDSEKIHVESAIESAKKGETNKFVKTMKLLGKHAINIVENIAGGALYEWLHLRGIL